MSTRKPCTVVPTVTSVLWAATCLAVILTIPVLAQPTSTIVCDPNIRLNNLSCPDGLICRRLAGDCGVFAGFCLDDPNSLSPTAFPNQAFCNFVCSNSTGRCEADIRPCNCDQYGGSCPEPCRLGYACLDGVCQEGDCAFDSDCPPGLRCDLTRPPRCVPPECTVGADCNSGNCIDGSCVECSDLFDCDDRQACQDGFCREVDCNFDRHCEPWQRCNTSLNVCVDVCAEGAERVQCTDRIPFVSGCVGALTPTCDGPGDCALGSTCCEGFCIPQAGGADTPEAPEELPPPDWQPPIGGPGGLFVFLLERGPKWSDDVLVEKLIQTDTMKEHFRYQERLGRRGIMILGGPFTDLSGAMGVVRARDERAAREIVEQDPAVQAGIYAVTSVHSWHEGSVGRDSAGDRK